MIHPEAIQEISFEYRLRLISGSYLKHDLNPDS